MEIIKSIFKKYKDRKYKGNQRLYFKAINPFRLEAPLNPEIWGNNFEDYDENDSEYNFELTRDYFENAWFYTELKEEYLSFIIFCNHHSRFRHVELYQDP